MTGFDITKVNRAQIECMLYKDTHDVSCSPIAERVITPPPPRPPSTPEGVIKVRASEMQDMQEKYARDLQNVQETYQ